MTSKMTDKMTDFQLVDLNPSLEGVEWKRMAEKIFPKNIENTAKVSSLMLSFNSYMLSLIFCEKRQTFEEMEKEIAILVDCSHRWHENLVVSALSIFLKVSCHMSTLKGYFVPSDFKRAKKVQ